LGLLYYLRLKIQSQAICSSSFVIFLFFSDVLTGSLFSEELLFGILEGLSKTTLEVSEGLSSLGLSLFGCLSVCLNVGSSGVLSISLSLLLSSSSGSVAWVDSLHEASVLEWVLLLLLVENGVSSDLSEFALNLITVDDSSEISAGHHVSVEDISTLLNTLGSVVTEDVVESLEGILGPDDESAEVTTWGE